MYRFVMAQEANTAILTDVHRVLVAVNKTLTSPTLAEFARHTLQMTKFETGLGSAESSVLLTASEVHLFMYVY